MPCGWLPVIRSGMPRGWRGVSAGRLLREVGGASLGETGHAPPNGGGAEVAQGPGDEGGRGPRERDAEHRPGPRGQERDAARGEGFVTGPRKEGEGRLEQEETCGLTRGLGSLEL